MTVSSLAGAGRVDPGPQAAAPAMSRVAEPVLSVRGLSAEFVIAGRALPVLRDVSFDVGPGEIVGLVGESGSGKSITAYTIMGLLDPPGRVGGGRVIFRERDVLTLPEAEMRRLRGRRIAMVFQDSNLSLNPVLRIDTQMVEAITAHEAVPRAEARRRARDALGLVGIPSPEERLCCYPHQLSGGMRQRVSIAIAMLHRPALIIADEPTTALDVTIQAQILGEMQDLVRRSGTALVWITHDLSVVSALTDGLVVMYAGQVVEAGATERVLASPAHPYTRGLIASLPGANRRGERLRQIPGQMPGIGHLDEGCTFIPRCERATVGCRATPPLVEQYGRRYRCIHPCAGETA